MAGIDLAARHTRPNMMKNTLAFSASLFLIGVALAGCNEVPPYTEGRAEPYPPPQIQLAGPDREDLRRSTVIDRPVQQRDDADLLVITVPIRATSDQILHVQYRVSFLDSNGVPLPGYPTGWFRKSLEPGAWSPIKFNSTTPKAEQWQMELRYAR
jgi:Protein of unknown function (DUF1425)